MQAEGLSPKSVRTYVGTLQAIFGAAVDSDLLARSPVRPRTLGLAPVHKPERPTLTADQLVRPMPFRRATGRSCCSPAPSG